MSCKGKEWVNKVAHGTHDDAYWCVLFIHWVHWLIHWWKQWQQEAKHVDVVFTIDGKHRCDWTSSSSCQWLHCYINVTKWWHASVWLPDVDSMMCLMVSSEYQMCSLDVARVMPMYLHVPMWCNTYARCVKAWQTYPLDRGYCIKG